jgi:hypothetical protein
MGLKSLPKHSAEYLLEVILRRYENRSTIMTSNRPLQDWGQLLGDVPSASAILDRFPAPRPDHCHHRPELPAQRPWACGRARREDPSQAQRTFDRRERELRLRGSLPARFNSLLTPCMNPQK